ncbi:zinc finger protein [Nocardia sp. NRRL S-836]|uniref:zinc finger protein n=1 Tax=Nocardia sp. NRRL S-836 TaxID=1519492 RepID=UPI0012FBE7AA
MSRSYKWQPHDGGRHAIPQELAVHDVGRTLCGLKVVVGPDVWPACERCWPTCVKCDRAWRAAENTLPWPREEDSYAGAEVSAGEEVASLS